MRLDKFNMNFLLKIQFSRVFNFICGRAKMGNLLRFLREFWRDFKEQGGDFGLGVGWIEEMIFEIRFLWRIEFGGD